MQRNNKANEIYQSLKNRILSGKYISPKDLTEISIANSYQVSRSTVKKALLMLESDGLLILEKNKGAKLYDLSLHEVCSMLELRSVLEGYIVWNATDHLSEKDLEDLEKNIRDMEKNVADNQILEYIKCNARFHDIIFKACTNAEAVKMTEQLKNKSRKYNGKTILIPGRLTASLNEHKEILKALRDRNKTLAKEKMEQHILNLKATFETYAELLIL